MPEQIIEVERRGQTMKRVGIPVCKGPATFRLMLTWPEEREGRIIEIPREEIASVTTAGRRRRGAIPAEAS